MTVAAIILAAGLSRRLGRPKQLLDWGGVPLVRHSLLTAQQSMLSAVAVVVGHQVTIAFLDLQFLRVHLGNVLSSFLYAALFLATIPTRLLLEV